MNRIDLRADCARCAALCCVAPAFDKSALFAFDKPAGEPCRNLDPCGNCRIYRLRAEEGFRGCIGYDCLGAGQRITQSLFNGRSWLEDRSLLVPMSEAFLLLRRVHELLLLLREAEKLSLSRNHRDCLGAFEIAAETLDATSPQRIVAFEAELNGFLRELRFYVDRQT